MVTNPKFNNTSYENWTLLGQNRVPLEPHKQNPMECGLLILESKGDMRPQQ